MKRSEIEYTESMIRLISFIRSKVLYYKTELSEIYREFSDPFLDSTGFTKTLLEEGFQKAFSDSGARYGLSQNTRKIIADFAENLGKISVEEQIISCDLAIESLNDHCIRQKERFPGQKKLYISLGALTGALIVILLI